MAGMKGGKGEKGGKKYAQADYWGEKARGEGYPARSVYKLQEIARKFGLLRGGRVRVLDLGAAPGSWSLYVLRTLGSAAFVAAADLRPLSRQYDRGLFDGANFRFIQGDVTAPEVRAALCALGPYDLVMSDAAPDTTGSRALDTLRSLALVEAALDYAETCLAVGGSLAVKVFQGTDTPAVLQRIRRAFQSGKSFKPQASRPSSFETYYIGQGRR